MNKDTLPKPLLRRGLLASLGIPEKMCYLCTTMAEEKDIFASAVKKEYSEGFVTDKKLL